MSTPRNKKQLTITLVNNQLVRNGRPEFINSTKVNLRVIKNVQDRRHILHGATQISDVLIDSFNRIIKKQGTMVLEKLIDGFLSRFKERGINFRAVTTLEQKVAKVITIAFSLTRNLAVGLATANQGIEQARKSIKTIKGKLDEYCAITVRTFNNIRTKTIELITTSLNTVANGNVAQYRRRVLGLLKESVEEASKKIQIVRLLSDFKFSCTLDIVHAGTTKEQNMWGITMANKLHRAILTRDDQVIYEILL